MIQQYVLDALTRIGEATAKEIAHSIREATEIRFSVLTVVSALAVLYLDGFVRQRRNRVRGRPTLWSVV